MKWANKERLRTVIVFAGALILYSLLRAPLTYNDEHVRLAWAMLHGQFYIENVMMRVNAHRLVAVWEQVQSAGHGYSIHPPMAAIACLPFVLGGMLNQVTISIIFGALGVALAWRLTRSLWLTAFFGFGTPYGYEVSAGTSWGMCLTLSCVFTLSALAIVQRGKAFRTGLWAGMAALTRYDLAMVIPLYAFGLAWVWRDWRRMVKFAGGVAIAAAVYVAFNEARYGAVLDHSIVQFYQADGFLPPAGRHGAFSFHYLPYSLYTALFAGAGYNPRWIFTPNMIGQALILTSPALVLALRPSLLRGETMLVWAAIILGMSGAMLVYANGVEQFGCRYWIQVLPFFLVLMNRRLDQMGKLLIVASIAIVTVGTLQLRGII